MSGAYEDAPASEWLPLRAASLSPLLTTADSAWAMKVIKGILAKNDDSVAPLLYY